MEKIYDINNLCIAYKLLNCTENLFNKTDEELDLYIMALLEWLQDLNYWRAVEVAERLKIFSGKKLKDAFITCFNRAVEADNDDGLIWLDYLSELLDNKELKELLPKEILETLQKHYHNWGAWYEDD